MMVDGQIELSHLQGPPTNWALSRKGCSDILSGTFGDKQKASLTGESQGTSPLNAQSNPAKGDV